MKKLFFIGFYILVSLSLFAQSDSIKSAHVPEVHIKAIRSSSVMITSQNNIKKTDLDYLNLGQDLPTLIQKLPAMNFSSDAGAGVGYSYLYIRGMDAQRIQVNINGIPYNDAESQEVYWVNIPDILSSADDIEVQRGVGFSTMGGTGIGGSVSIKTTKMYTRPFISLSSSLGSFNTFKNTINTSTGLLHDGWQVTARGSILQSDGYIDRASSRLGSAYIDISKYGTKFSSHLIASHGRERTYQAWYGVSQADMEAGLRTKNIAGTDYESKSGNPYENQVDNYNQSHLQWLSNFIGKRGHQASFSAFMTKGKGYYEEYKVDQDYASFSSDLSGRGDAVRQLWLSNYFYGMNASHILENEKYTNTTAISINQYRGYHYGMVKDLLSLYTGTIPNEFYQNNSVKTDMMAFNKFSYKQRKSKFVLDLQIRNVVYSATGNLRNQALISFDKNYLFFNPKLGWNMNLKSDEKLKLYNNVFTFLGLSHREPVRSDFIDEESSHQPLPEKVYNLELGYKHRHKNIDFSSNLFAMYFIDQLIPTGNINSVGAPIRENVASSYRAGVEAEFSIKIKDKITLYTNQYLALNKILDYTNYLITYNDDYSINDAKTMKQNFSSTDIAFSPSWISTISVKYSPFKHSEFTHTSLELINKLISSQFLDNTMSDTKSLPMYTYTNLSLSHEVKLNKWLKEVKLNLLLNNIFDQKYSSRGYTYFSGNTANSDGSVTAGQDYNYYFPQAGFNFLAGVSLKW
jgi:iron complex outermembrane recepter protein